MKNVTAKLPNGEAVREFYSSIKTIEEYYQEKGYRKKAYLYRTLKEKLGWKMSLESFKYHFKKAFETNDIQHSLDTQTVSKRSESEMSNKDITPKEDNNSPIIPPSTISKGFNYNPNTTEKDPRKTI